jgi:hypothetical protein
MNEPLDNQIEENAAQRSETSAVWRFAVVLWLAILIGVTVRAALAAPTSGSVFTIYTAAAHAWIAGDDLYTLDFSKPCYRYHPLIAVSFVPWTALPDRLAAIVWRWLGAGLLFWGVAAFLRHVVLRPLSLSERGWLLLLIAPLALQSINNAQVNTHITGLLLLGLSAAAQKRWTLAAALVAAATIFKLYPIAIGLLLSAVFPRRFAGRYLLMLAGSFVIPFLAQRPDYVLGQYDLWFEYLGADVRHVAAIEQAPRDLYFLLRVWLVSPPELVYRLVQGAVAGLLAIWCLVLQRRQATPERVLTTILHLGCIWMTLLGPSTESSTYTLLGPSAALLVLEYRRNGPSWIAWLAGAGYALLALPALATAFPDGKSLQLWAPQPAGATLLLIAAIGWSRGSCTRPAENPETETVGLAAA